MRYVRSSIEEKPKGDDILIILVEVDLLRRQILIQSERPDPRRLRTIINDLILENLGLKITNKNVID